MARPSKIEKNDQNLQIARGLGEIQATTKEIAAVFGVTEPTWFNTVKRHPEFKEAYEDGLGQGRVSLRRKQFQAANEGNATMLVWLGKQYLGQTDKQEVDAQITRTEVIVELGSNEYREGPESQAKDKRKAAVSPLLN